MAIRYIYIVHPALRSLYKRPSFRLEFIKLSKLDESGDILSETNAFHNVYIGGKETASGRGVREDTGGI